MASPFTSSNLPTLGRALLRVSPLVISSASLMFSWAQTVAFGSFLVPELQKDPAHPSGNILPRYMPAFMKPGLWGIALTYPTAMLLSIANSFSGQSLYINRLYLIGGLFSLGHFYWGPRMMKLLYRISDPKEAGVRNEKDMASWIPIHHRRTFSVNVPAWLCLLAATLGTIAEGLN
ncbi:hypothetical protein F5B20DRAFT_148513 [Whalleya microplaca]|nr:hypothetical protein F5B20DRAFT_148513 [Whalleya microplaca]